MRPGDLALLHLAGHAFLYQLAQLEADLCNLLGINCGHGMLAVVVR